MDHLFCLDNRVIGGAPDRIADLADLAIAMLRAANVGDRQPIGDLGVFQCVVKIAGRDDVWCCTVVIVGNSIRLASGVELGDALG